MIGLAVGGGLYFAAVISTAIKDLDGISDVKATRALSSLDVAR